MATDVLQLLEIPEGSPVAETVYNGYRFKKRLEARWAVFFDALSIPYRYEFEEFNFGDEITFAPSFFLPTLKCWIHIVDSEPTSTEDFKANLLALATQQNVYIYFGDCWRPDDLLREGNQSGYGYLMRDTDYGLDVFFEDKCWWCHCETCDSFGIAPGGRIDLLPCKHNDQETTNVTSMKLIAAYMKARQARFEESFIKTIKLEEIGNIGDQLIETDQSKSDHIDNPSDSHEDSIDNLSENNEDSIDKAFEITPDSSTDQSIANTTEEQFKRPTLILLSNSNNSIS